MREKEVFNYIKSHKNCTITQISDSLKIAFPDVFSLTESLLNKGVIGYFAPALGLFIDDSACFYAKIDNYEK